MMIQKLSSHLIGWLPHVAREPTAGVAQPTQRQRPCSSWDPSSLNNMIMASYIMPHKPLY